MHEMGDLFSAILKPSAKVQTFTVKIVTLAKAKTVKIDLTSLVFPDTLLFFFKFLS